MRNQLRTQNSEYKKNMFFINQFNLRSIQKLTLTHCANSNGWCSFNFRPQIANHTHYTLNSKRPHNIWVTFIKSNRRPINLELFSEFSVRVATHLSVQSAPNTLSDIRTHHVLGVYWQMRFKRHTKSYLYTFDVLTFYPIMGILNYIITCFEIVI